MNANQEIQKAKKSIKTNVITGTFSLTVIVSVICLMIADKLPKDLGIASTGYIIMLFGFLFAFIVDIVMIFEDVQLIKDLKQI
jgi:hypothetical protein